MSLLSAVMPVYNDVGHLAGALDRLLRQRGVDLEVVVVDDGSRDGSLEVARDAAARDPRVVVVEVPQNRGVARARELGVQRAKGEHVWFVDSDDDWPVDAAAAMQAAATAGDLDVVVAGARFCYTDGSSRELPAPAVPGVLDGAGALQLGLTGRITGHLWNKLFQRELLLQVPAVPSRTQSDLPLVLGALARARRVGALDRLVYEYRLRPSSIITSTRQRADCLALVDAAVRDTVLRCAPQLVGSQAQQYFETRYVVLSGLKDAELGGYDAGRRTELVTALRRRLGPRSLLALVRQRDPQRLLVALSALAGGHVHRRVLRAAAR